MKTKLLAGLILVVLASGVFWLATRRNEPSVVPPSKPKEKVVRLRFGHDMPEDTAQHTAALKFADIVDYKSAGRIKISVFPNQQLGTDQEMIEMARQGTLDIILPPTSKMTTLLPEMQLLDLPFLFAKREDLYEILDGKPGQMLLESLQPHGLIGVAIWESGFKQFTSNRKIRTPNDFKNLNIRVMKSSVIMEQFRSFGSNPIPIDFHKTYQALQDGVVDGEENPISSIFNMGFYKVQSHLTISNHAYLAQAFVFSQSVFEALPPAVQEILRSTAIEITSFERKEVIARETRYLEQIKAAGVAVNELTQEEKQLFQAASQHSYETYRQNGGRILDEVQRLLREKYRAIQNEIVIGLNADLVGGSALSGQAIKRGMELAIREINEKGGVLGKKLKIVARDNSGIAAHGIDNMEYFITLDNMVAVMGGIYSPIALAELDIIHREKIVFLDPWAAATGIVDNGQSPNYVFRVSVRDEFAGPFLVHEALKKYRKIALLLVNDGWGKGNHQGITAALAERNHAPVAVEWFNWGETNMGSQLERIEKAQADVILLVAGASEGATIIKNIARRSIGIPVISHWGITGGHFWKAVNRELEQVSLSFLQSFSFMNAAGDRQRDLIRRYFKAYQVDHPGKIFAPVGTAHAYDLVHLLALAIAKAGRTDRPAVRDALESIESHRGIVKDYAPPFTANRHDALDASSFFLATYNQQGYIVPSTE
ncbi:MAG: DctP family TRAP transporter solute-binding subunit [Proteobacteria bacterium]|nr:DctP family TRAP transporter solute-binding subunit [Pseudomonadota bacterium]